MKTEEQLEILQKISNPKDRESIHSIAQGYACDGDSDCQLMAVLDGINMARKKSDHVYPILTGGDIDERTGTWAIFIGKFEKIKAKLEKLPSQKEADAKREAKRTKYPPCDKMGLKIGDEVTVSKKHQGYLGNAKGKFIIQSFLDDDHCTNNGVALIKKKQKPSGWYVEPKWLTKC